MKYDLMIIGGGMVGAALACALQNSALSIALIDANSLTPAEDPRLIALNASSCELFKNLKIWPSLAVHAAPIRKIHVSSRGQFGTTCIDAAELHLTTLGHVIPAKDINVVLDEKLKTLSNLTIFRPAALKNFSQTDHHITAEIEINDQKERIQANFLVGADGTHSTVRKILNFSTKTIDYQQSAIVTVTELQRSHHGVAYERFIKTGAIAMLPLPENRVATIWTDRFEMITHLMQLNDAEFLEQLQKQFGYRLGRLVKINPRFTFPLKFIQAEKQIHGNVILIGNAAHTLHPVAAQGLNLALCEIALLAKQFGESNFELLNFTGYTQQKSSMRLSHYLPQIFGSDFFPLVKARQLGLLGLDLFTPLKKRFAEKAMGQ